jgi:hypothetical protein
MLTSPWVTLIYAIILCFKHPHPMVTRNKLVPSIIYTTNYRELLQLQTLIHIVPPKVDTGGRQTKKPKKNPKQHRKLKRWAAQIHQK